MRRLIVLAVFVLVSIGSSPTNAGDTRCCHWIILHGGTFPYSVAAQTSSHFAHEAEGISARIIGYTHATNLYKRLPGRVRIGATDRVTGCSIYVVSHSNNHLVRLTLHCPKPPATPSPEPTPAPTPAPSPAPTPEVTPGTP